MDIETIQQGPSWSVIVLVNGPEGKTIAQGVSSSIDDQMRKLPKGESIAEDGPSPRNTAMRVLKDETGLDIHISQLELKGKRITSKDRQYHLLFMFVAKVLNSDGLLSDVQKKKRSKKGYKLLDLKSVTGIPGFFQADQQSVKIVYPRRLITRKS